MKRRTFLLALGGTAALAWGLKPGDHGAPYSPYFQRLNTLFREHGPGRPLLFIDQQRLAANCRRLMASLPPGRDYRIVSKSLPSVPLIRTVMAQTGSKRVMVFHQPFINALAQAQPDSDMLLGKPMPVNAAARFYQELPTDAAFQPDRQLQWLIDTPARLDQYLALARKLGRRLRINIEIDVGLHRGGLTAPEQLDTLLKTLHANPRHLQFSGFMGYDAHVGKLPSFIESAQASHEKSNAVYQSYIDRLYQLAPDYRHQRLTFNGAGSPTFRRHGAHTPLNELSAGSCLVKPSDFDLDLLADLQPAAFIATPVLKHLHGLHLPGPLPIGDAWALWDPNREETYFIYGGNWKARPVAPAGIESNALYGVSSNQMMYNGSSATALNVGDMIFFRPTQSEFVLLNFGDLAAVDEQHITAWWPPLSQGRGA